MLDNLSKLGFKYMTPIQQASLQDILNGNDILAKAKTGSGKTVAFGIGVLSHFDVKKFRVQSLILCPTRELSIQVANELRNLAKFQHNIKILTLIGGESFGKQLKSLSHQAHIVVGTPGRVLKHLNHESLYFDNLKTLVLDEADRMLDMGFIEEIEMIRSHITHQVQTLLFSATYNDEVLAISKKLQVKPRELSVEEQEQKNEVEEIFIAIDNNKQQTLLKLLAYYKPKNAIIFVNTKVQADGVAEFLQDNKIDALSLHGDLEQYDRLDALVQFSNASCRVLVATDVASRGLDIKELFMVINYDMPSTQETYVHRIGRTARAGEKGLAVSLYNDPLQQEVYQNVKYLDAQILQNNSSFTMHSEYKTIVLEGGKRDKLRAGDILGAITSQQTLKGSDIGKIDIYKHQSYLAIKVSFIYKACSILNSVKIKTRKYKAWVLE